MTAAPVDRATASRLVALEYAWTAIRSHHPEVPQVVIVVASGSGPRSRRLNLGHFAAGCWQLTNPDPAPEQAPASDLARLLTEAAQQVLPPRMATAFQLRYRLDRGRYRTLAPGRRRARRTRERARQAHHHRGRAAAPPGSLRAGPRPSPRPLWAAGRSGRDPGRRPWWGGYARPSAGSTLDRVAVPATQGWRPAAAGSGRDALAGDRHRGRHRL
jgi:hypothetical protein